MEDSSRRRKMSGRRDDDTPTKVERSSDGVGGLSDEGGKNRVSRGGGGTSTSVERSHVRTRRQ